MGTKVATKGSVECVRGRWRTLVTFPKGPARPKRLRQWWWLDARDEAAARAQALKLGAAARAGKLEPLDASKPPAPAKPRPWDTIPDKLGDGRETVKGWCGRWIAERSRRGHKSLRGETSCLRTWVWPRVGHLAMAAVTRADLEAWVEAIDEAVREEELSWKTALNAWGLVSKMFSDACAGKPRELRVRADDPSEKVSPPDRGARKGKQFLYPSEFLRLVGCDAVEEDAREVYAVAAYLYPRAGELEALHCEDLDLTHGTAHIHRARDPDTGAIRETKGNRPRWVPIHPRALPLLARLVERAGGRGLLWPEWPLWKDRSGRLRTHLARAGVTREALFEGDDTRKAMTFHDLRATGITWEAIAGTDAVKIQQRAGHTSMNTTLIYIRLGDAVRGVGFGEPFPPLPWIGSTIGSTGGEDSRETPLRKAARMVRGEGFEPTSRVSNGSESRRSAGGAGADPPQPGPVDAVRDGRGTDRGTNPRGALEAAVRAALDADDHGLAAELLGVMRRRGQLADVVDLDAARAKRCG